MPQPSTDQFVLVAIRYTRDSETEDYATEVQCVLDVLENMLVPNGWDSVGQWEQGSRAFTRSDADSGTERVSFAIMP